MLLEHMGETVQLEQVDGSFVSVPHVLMHEADQSDQTVMDVQTRFINQARYKGDSRTLTVIWPKSAPQDLMDTHLIVRGERYRVYSEPFPMSHTPNGYSMRVTCIRSLFLYDADLLASTTTQDEWGVWHEEFVAHPTKANLLRLSETAEVGAGQTDLSQIVLLELPPNTWDADYTAFDFQGKRHTIRSVDTAGECVVVSGTMEAVS